jgi:membrane protein YdbS with pleckstrin-like domain
MASRNKGFGALSSLPPMPNQGPPNQPNTTSAGGGAPQFPGQAPVPARAQAPAGSVAQPGSEELIYYGPAKHGAYALDYAKWALASVAAGVLANLLGRIELFASWPLWVLSFIGLPGMLWTFLRHSTTRFRISLRRIEFERGILSKSVDSLELWRVLDVKYSQNIIERMLGIAKVTVMSTDQSTPELCLNGLPNARELFEKLRDAVQLARHSNRPMELVGGDGHGMMEHVGH